MWPFLLLAALRLAAAGPACTGFVDAYGQGCADADGVLPALTAEGCPAPGAELLLHVNDHGPRGAAFLLMGAGHASLPFLQGCTLQVSELHSPPFLPLALAPGGSSTFALRIPPGLALQDLFLQVVLPTGAATNGLEVAFAH